MHKHISHRTALALAALNLPAGEPKATPRPIGAKKVTKGDIEALRAAESKRERRRLKRIQQTGGQHG